MAGRLFALDLLAMEYDRRMGRLMGNPYAGIEGYVYTGARWLDEVALASQSGPCVTVVPGVRRPERRRSSYFHRVLERSWGHRRGKLAREILTPEVLAAMRAEGWTLQEIADWLTPQVAHIGNGRASGNMVGRIEREYARQREPGGGQVGPAGHPGGAADDARRGAAPVGLPQPHRRGRPVAGRVAGDAPGGAPQSGRRQAGP